MIETISGSRVFKAAKRVRVKWVNRFLTLNRDDQLGNNWKDLSATLLKHVEDTLDGEESVWILLFTDTLKEDWEIMMIVELLDLHFPVDAELRTVLDGNREISAVVESTELRRWNASVIESTSNWFLSSRAILWLIQTNSLSTKTLTFLQSG